jgi:hypothetical protein
LKSHLFTDTQDFDREWACPPDKICICLRLDRQFYQDLCNRAAMKGLTSSQYMEQTVKAWEALAESVPNALSESRPPAGGYAGSEN